MDLTLMQSPVPCVATIGSALRANRDGMTERQDLWSNPSLQTPTMPRQRSERSQPGAAALALRTGRFAGSTGGHSLDPAGTARTYRCTSYGPLGKRASFSDPDHDPNGCALRKPSCVRRVC